MGPGMAEGGEGGRAEVGGKGVQGAIFLWFGGYADFSAGILISGGKIHFFEIETDKIFIL